MQHNRKLKVGYNTREVQNRINGNNLKFIPQLTLQGNWFQDAGFEIGDTAHINICEGIITITKNMLQHEMQDMILKPVSIVHQSTFSQIIETLKTETK